MEFGNLKKRLALGLAGVMAFTMAAPVGLTAGQEASSVSAAEAYSFIATPNTTVNARGFIEVGEINTPSVQNLYKKMVKQVKVSLSDADYGYATMTNQAVKLEETSYGADGASVITNGLAKLSVGWDAGTADLDRNKAGHIFFVSSNKVGTVDLKIVGTGEESDAIDICEQKIPLTVVDKYSASFDIRTGAPDKTVVSSLNMKNTKPEDLSILVKSTGAGTVVRTLDVKNSNVGLVMLTTNAAATKHESSAYDDHINLAAGVTAASTQANEVRYIFKLVPNGNAKGKAEIQFRLRYTKGNDATNKEYNTDWQTLTVNVQDMKNILNVEYQAGSVDMVVSSEDTETAFSKGFVNRTRTESVKSTSVGIEKGWAIMMDNSNNSSEIKASSDVNADIEYRVTTAGINAGEAFGTSANDLNEYLAVSNTGKLTLKKTVTDICTGVVSVVATGKAGSYDASKWIHVPVQLSYKEQGYGLVKENNRVVNGWKNNKSQQTDPNEKIVYLSSTDVGEKTLTFESNVDDDYIKWTSSDSKLVEVKGGNGEVNIKYVGNVTEEKSVDITAEVKESTNVDNKNVAANVGFKVVVTPLKLTNPLTCEDDVIYIQHGESKKIDASYAGGNVVKYELASYNTETNTIRGEGKTENDKISVGQYDGALKVKNPVDSGAIFVKVQGVANDQYRADDTKFVHVFYNMNEDDSKDEVTGTKKYTLSVGDEQILDAVSEKGSGLSYESDDATVATVDGSGKVTAVKPGTAVITVKSTGYDATMNVTIVVNKPAEDQDVVTGKASYSVKVGKTVTSDAESSLGNALTWSSSNTKVATVSKTGVIKGVKAGKAVVTATAKNSGAKLEINVTVSKNNQSLTVTGKKVTKKVALKKNKTTKKITIKKAAALTVKNAKGTVTYKKANGNSKITVNSKTGNITVKKGIKKGTYKVKVTVNAAGNNTYNKASKTATVTIVIKKK